MDAFAKLVHWVDTKTRVRIQNVEIVHLVIIQIRQAILIVLCVHSVNNAVVHGVNLVLVETLAKIVHRDILRLAASNARHVR